MRSANFELMTTALLAATVSLFAFGCDADSTTKHDNESGHVAALEQTNEVDENGPEIKTATKSVATALATSATIPELDEPVLASATDTPKPTPASSTGRRVDHDLRDPGLLPAGTPEINAEAFASLPLAKRDKAPIAGAGASGIHLDELVVGKGWANSRCEDLGTLFVPGVDDRISVCFRVVHPREAEQVTVEWARDGKLRQSIRVGVRDSHTYRTRAWMPVTEGRAGQWTATVKSDDGQTLGQASFEVRTAQTPSL